MSPVMTNQQKYLLHLADNALILGQRLGEWCGHGPVLEQDIALTNISLDLIGQARLIYQHIASTLGGDEDEIAFVRKEQEYFNLLLVEQSNGNFADTIARQFFFDVFNFYNYQQLTKSVDENLAAIAVKSLKEVKYHLRHSSEWVIRLGDGTTESHEKMQNAVDQLWMFTGEMFVPSSYEKELKNTGFNSDVAGIKELWMTKVEQVLQQATLTVPTDEWMQSGGKEGSHTEKMGFILAELQYMQRAYPGLKW